MPQRRTESELEGESKEELEERDRVERGASPPTAERDRFGREPEIEVYQEGHHMIIEDEEGNVLKTEDTSNLTPEEQARHIEEQRKRLEQDRSGELAPSRSQPHEKTEGEEIQQAIGEQTGHPVEKARSRWTNWTGFGKDKTKEKPEEAKPKPKPQPQPKPAEGGKKARSAHAYQFGNTIIVEDEDGEVIKKYTIPSGDKSAKPKPKPEEPQPGKDQAPIRAGLKRMGTWFGMEEEGEPSQAGQKNKPVPRTETDDWATDDGLRFTLAQSTEVDSQGIGHKGRRMTKHEFFQQIKGLDPKARRDLVQQTDAPAPVKEAAHEDVKQTEKQERRLSAAAASAATGAIPEEGEDLVSESVTDSDVTDEEDSTDDRGEQGPNVATSLAKFTRGSSAQERRSNLSPAPRTRDRRRRDSDDDGTERIPPSRLRQEAGLAAPPRQIDDDTGETPAERRRRLAALGEIHNDDSSDSEAEGEAAIPDSDSEDNGEPRQVQGKVQFADSARPSEQPSPSEQHSSSSGSGSGSSKFTPGHRPRISWGGEKGREH
jgi:hypothetical protein